MNRRLLAVALGVVLSGSVFVPRAMADQGNKEVRFTINAPVEIPGTVLPAGNYDLKLKSFGSSVAGISNAKGNKFYGYFDTIPVDRAHRGKVNMVFAGSGKNAPQRLEEWFYPGDRTGNEILYPTAENNVRLANTTTPNRTMDR
jgi:hypothetical protein